MSQPYFLPRPLAPNAPTSIKKTYGSISNSVNVQLNTQSFKTPVPQALQRLSKREVQVATGLIKGASVKNLAAQLGIAEKTIKFHKTNIYKAYNVKGIAQFIITVMALGGL